MTSSEKVRAAHVLVVDDHARARESMALVLRCGPTSCAAVANLEPFLTAGERKKLAKNCAHCLDERFASTAPKGAPSTGSTFVDTHGKRDGGACWALVFTVSPIYWSVQLQRAAAQRNGRTPALPEIGLGNNVFYDSSEQYKAGYVPPVPGQAPQARVRCSVQGDKAIVSRELHEGTGLRPSHQFSFDPGKLNWAVLYGYNHSAPDRGGLEVVVAGPPEKVRPLFERHWLGQAGIAPASADFLPESIVKQINRLHAGTPIEDVFEIVATPARH